MHRTLSSILISTTVLICISKAQAQATPATQPSTAPSGTHYAIRVVQIPDNPQAVVLRDYNVILERLVEKRHKSGVELDTEPVLRDVDSVHVKMTLIAEQPIAKEAMDQLIGDLQAELNERHDRWKADQLEPSIRTIDRSAAKVNQLTRDLTRRQSNARSLTERADVSPTGIREAASAMDAEQQRLELEQVGKAARRRAIEEEIALQSRKIEQRVSEDLIAVELQTIVEAREQVVKQNKMLQEQGQMSDRELGQSIAAAAEARAKLLQRRLDATAEVGGETLEALNQELTTLAIDLAELEARLKYVENERTELAEAMREVEPIPALEAELQAARLTLNRAESELETIRTELIDSEPPKITVISGENLETPPAPDSLFP